MTRNQESDARKHNRLRGITQAVRRLFTRHRSDGDTQPESVSTTASAQPRSTAQQSQQFAKQPKSDIPIDLLDRSYQPPLTSSKTSFRSDGSDHHADQEFMPESTDERWNDEDHYTNRSGDPRIGTHGRAGAHERERARK